MAKQPIHDEDDMEDVTLPTVKAEPNPASPQHSTPTRSKELMEIWLEDHPDIPPTGLYVGHNGDGYRIPKGQWVRIPKFLKGVLDDAIVSSPVINPETGQPETWIDKRKYNYQTR
jgi:hypothetical protein